MATLNTTLTLTSTDVSSDTLSMTVTDVLTVIPPQQSISMIIASTTGGDNIIKNISGNIMSEDYTEDVIIPQIREALRRGESI